MALGCFGRGGGDVSAFWDTAAEAELRLARASGWFRVSVLLGGAVVRDSLGGCSWNLVGAALAVPASAAGVDGVPSSVDAPVVRRKSIAGRRGACEVVCLQIFLAILVLGGVVGPVGRWSMERIHRLLGPAVLRNLARWDVPDKKSAKVFSPSTAKIEVSKVHGVAVAVAVALLEPTPQRHPCVGIRCILAQMHRKTPVRIVGGPHGHGRGI